MKNFFLCFAVLSVFSVANCASGSYQGRSTAELTTPGIVALQTTEVVKVLDVIRDIAIDAEATKIIPTNTASHVVSWHKAALQTMKDTPSGWRAIVLSSLTNLKGTLSPSELSIIGPYIDSATSIIKAVFQ